MAPIDLQLILTGEEDALPIQNLWPLYVHDVSAYDGQVPNGHGVFMADASVRTLAEQGASQRAWWSQPKILYPYLARVDGVPAGFNLIASGPYVPTAGVDFTVFEFFVANPFRGSGVAARIAREGIARHRGRWEVVTHPTNARAIAFWRKTLPSCALGELSETEEDHPFGRKIVWRFDNLDREEPRPSTG